MQKLTLNVDALKVEAFQTVDAHDEAKGTVLGQAVTLAVACATAGSCGHICP